jgi:hypothetical protein
MIGTKLFLSVFADVGCAIPVVGLGGALSRLWILWFGDPGRFP